MILFLEDWYKHPTAIVHKKTRNRSFIRFAGLLKKMGIKNHTFMLALHNPLLEKIDPHSDKLTMEEKIMIAVEVRDNPWYFYREVARIPPPAGSESIPLKANRANISTIWLSLNHITSFLIQPRQTGKSLIGNLIDAYSINISANNTNLTILTKDDKLRAKTARDIKDIIERLPDYLQLLNKKDITNTEKVTVKLLGNSLNIYVGQKDKKAADNLGRGLTIPIVRIDEFAYIYNIETSLPVILSATTAAREVSKKVGSPHYTMFTTTPGKLNSPDGRFAYQVYNDSLRWSEKFYDTKDEETLNTILEKNSKMFKVILTEFNHRQLGFSDEWLKERLSVALSKGDAAESDFFNKWINGNISSPIPKELLNIIVESKRTQNNPFVSKFGYVIRWYVDNVTLRSIKEKDSIIIGLDTSDALGGKNDDMGLVIRDSMSGAVLGVGKYNETNLSMFADFLVELLEEFPKAILIPERRSSAVAIMDNMFRIMLTKRMNPFKRIFNWLVNDMNTTNIGSEDMLIKRMPTLIELSKNKKKFGFATSSGGASSRGLLYGNVFRASLTYTADKVYDPSLISQLSGLRIVGNKIDHESGSHDDLVIAWLLTYYFLQYAKNTEVYGLHYSQKLNSVVDIELLNSNKDVKKETIAEQVKIKNTIDRYVKDFNKITNEVKAVRLLSKIKQLESRIDSKIITNLNIDALLKDIKMYKRLQSNNVKYSQELAA